MKDNEVREKYKERQVNKKFTLYIYAYICLSN